MTTTSTHSDLSGFLESLVQANKILVHFGIVDAFGHVSARHPDKPDRFLMTRRLAPALVTKEDILEYDLDAEPVRAKQTPTFIERFIHSEMYKSRPDVHAVVHSHSPLIVATSTVSQRPFKPLCHTCGFLGDGVPFFEIRDYTGEGSNLLITSQKLGHELAKKIGDKSFILMRGHGSTAVGPSVQQAVYRAVYAELNARIQLSAVALGEPLYLTPQEAAACEETASLQVERTWAYWLDLIS
jgi:ribulose-5-phosphate 4-epimerase/fuculose-1-phosphate aldolase